MSVFATHPEVELICPKCGSSEVRIGHAYANSALPECYFKECEICEHQWDPS